MSAGLDLILDDLAFDAWQKTLTRRWMCADCGRELVLPPPRADEETPYCCDWQMVELPPLDFVDELAARRQGTA